MASVEASEATKQELGVVEWQVMPGEQPETFLVVGLDGEGTTKAEVVMGGEPIAAGRATFTYAVKAPEVFTLRYDLDEQKGTSNAAEAENAPLARAVIVRMGEDLKDIDAAQPLTTQSISLRPQELVKRGQQLRSTGNCMLDSDGKRCWGKWLGAAAGLVGAGACLLATPLTFGGSLACAAAAGLGYGAALMDIRDSGCKMRPCSDRK